MFPKVGDIVKLNHSFLKEFFRRGNKYFGEEVWEEKFTVTKVEKYLEHDFRIVIKSKDSEYILYLLHNGELSSWPKKYEGIQVFIPANISETKKDDIYCSCGGPKKENWVFGEKFYVCTICKKERI